MQSPFRTAREHRGMTQVQLAEKVGVSKSHICAIEAGAKRPSVELLKAIAEALGVSTDYLLSEDDTA